ncbi:receptor-like protein EIX1 [Bidens hawaiensis]|uniref:receptor-like protein EIX1 n=1 Tax=Bidens hawaiensis TaxID=980011 RepID=UPI004049DE34
MEITNSLVIFIFLFFLIISTSIVTTSSNATSCIQRERKSLLVFKQSLTDTYHLLSAWKGENCCEWKGVGCDSRNGHVVMLDLRGNMLQGELSPSLQNLKRLHYLDLSGNGFSASTPKFLGSFERLKYLDLSDSGLGGLVPHHLGNLSRLQYLDLCSSSFMLDDLGWVSPLSSLRYLNLSGIAIGKRIDWLHPVNMLRSLLTLNLAECEITNVPS